MMKSMTLRFLPSPVHPDRRLDPTAGSSPWFFLLQKSCDVRQGRKWFSGPSSASSLSKPGPQVSSCAHSRGVREGELPSGAGHRGEVPPHPGNVVFESLVATTCRQCPSDLLTASPQQTDEEAAVIISVLQRGRRVKPPVYTATVHVQRSRTGPAGPMQNPGPELRSPA